MSEMESLGMYLKREREIREIPLREVSKNIRVREYFLKAVEEDRHDLLPSPTYVKGFLYAYAKFIGLDPNEVIGYYESFLKGESIIRQEVPAKRKISWNTKYLWIIGGVILIGFFSFYFFVLQPSKPSTERVFPKPEVKETPPAIPPPVAEKPSVPEERPMLVQLKAVERTWVLVQVNHQPEQDIMLQPGESISYQAMQRIQLIVGNVGGLDIIFNEKRLERFGKSGEVFTLVFTPQGVEAKRREVSEPPQE